MSIGDLEPSLGLELEWRLSKRVPFIKAYEIVPMIIKVVVL